MINDGNYREVVHGKTLINFVHKHAGKDRANIPKRYVRAGIEFWDGLMGDIDNHPVLKKCGGKPSQWCRRYWMVVTRDSDVGKKQQVFKEDLKRLLYRYGIQLGEFKERIKHNVSDCSNKLDGRAIFAPGDYSVIFRELAHIENKQEDEYYGIFGVESPYAKPFDGSARRSTRAHIVPRPRRRGNIKRHIPEDGFSVEKHGKAFVEVVDKFLRDVYPNPPYNKPGMTGKSTVVWNDLVEVLSKDEVWSQYTVKPDSMYWRYGAASFYWSDEGQLQKMMADQLKDLILKYDTIGRFGQRLKIQSFGAKLGAKRAFTQVDIDIICEELHNLDGHPVKHYYEVFGYPVPEYVKTELQSSTEPLRPNVNPPAPSEHMRPKPPPPPIVSPSSGAAATPIPHHPATRMAEAVKGGIVSVHLDSKLVSQFTSQDTVNMLYKEMGRRGDVAKYSDNVLERKVAENEHALLENIANLLKAIQNQQY